MADSSCACAALSLTLKADSTSGVNRSCLSHEPLNPSTNQNEQPHCTSNQLTLSIKQALNNWLRTPLFGDHLDHVGQLTRNTGLFIQKVNNIVLLENRS